MQHSKLQQYLNEVNQCIHFSCRMIKQIRVELNHFPWNISILKHFEIKPNRTAFAAKATNILLFGNDAFVLSPILIIQVEDGINSERKSARVVRLCYPLSSGNGRFQIVLHLTILMCQAGRERWWKCEAERIDVIPNWEGIGIPFCIII